MFSEFEESKLGGFGFSVIGESTVEKKKKKKRPPKNWVVDVGEKGNWSRRPEGRGNRTIVGK